jgi:hypothetical protein
MPHGTPQKGVGPDFSGPLPVELFTGKLLQRARPVVDVVGRSDDTVFPLVDVEARDCIAVTQIPSMMTLDRKRR